MASACGLCGLAQGSYAGFCRVPSTGSSWGWGLAPGARLLTAGPHVHLLPGLGARQHATSLLSSGAERCGISHLAGADGTSAWARKPVGQIGQMAASVQGQAHEGRWRTIAAVPRPGLELASCV